MTAKLAIRGGTPVRTRPFHPWPVSDEEDKARLLRVLASGTWAGEGPFERELERRFAERHDARGAVTVTNGTVSLLLCLRAIGIMPGDEVILPALTWTATATSVLEVNAVPVLVDVDPNTYCIDPAAVRAAITPRSVAIIPVHLYSCMTDMDELRSIALRHSLAIIEDCAHAHGARWRGQAAGSLGTLGSFSFQSSKPMTAGEGGAVIGSDRSLLDKIYSQRNCGRHGVERGAPILAGNHRMTEWQSAVLLGQLARLDERHKKREAGIKRLRERIAGLPGIAILDDQPAVTTRPIYRLSFRYDDRAAGGVPLLSFVEAVRAEGVPFEFTYRPVYANPLWRDGIAAGVSWYPGKIREYRCDESDRISYKAGFTLPHEVLLGPEEDIDDIAEALHKVSANPGEAAHRGDRAKELVKDLLRKVR
jgi:dTDP-4-amino-4,6-dideoxygalactose transaminase